MCSKVVFFSKLSIVVLVVLLFQIIIIEAQPLNKTPAVLISAVYPDGYQTGGRDEAFQLMNVGYQEIDITGWSVTNNKTTITFPGVGLTSGEKIWCSRTAIAFEEEFGGSPDFEYGDNSNTDVRDMTGNPLNLIKAGGELVLLNAEGIIVDTMVYGTGNVEQPGWKGDSVKPYSAGRAKGQILYRKLDQTTGRPVPDTDTVADWAQDPNDPINGRKVMYPGWNLDEYFQTTKVTEMANLTILVTPDNAYEPIREQIELAKHSIHIEAYTFEHAVLAEVIADRARAGVNVKILLEGGLRMTGITDQERWCCQQVEMAGGWVYFMVHNPPERVYARYGNQHAKFIIIDNRVLIMGSDNLGYGSIPDDPKEDGTRGRRGVMLITDAPTLVGHAQRIFAADCDTNLKDICRFTGDDRKYGGPPSHFTPDRVSGGTAYEIIKPEPLRLTGTFGFEIVQSPENSLRDQDGLLGLVAKAGKGDVILVEQQYELKYWGPKDSSPEADPNPRLEAYIAAARRGATVRILLDNCYASVSDPKGSVATCEYVNNIARTEDLQLEARLGNPAGGVVFEEIIAGRDYEGIHNKMILVRINGQGQGYAHIGSINGSEVSSKVNRELAVQIRSDEVYSYLDDVFEYDWSVSELPIEIPGWH